MTSLRIADKFLLLDLQNKKPMKNDNNKQKAEVNKALVALNSNCLALTQLKNF